MTPVKQVALAALLAAAGAAPAAAQDGALQGWTFALSPYAWLPGISTSTETGNGRIDLDLTPADAISDLDFAFMGAAEARKGRWAAIVDFIYTDLTTHQATPLQALWSEAQLRTKLAATTVYAGYRVVDTEATKLDVLAGGRFYDLDMTLSLEPGRLAGRSRSFDDSWADPVFGMRGIYDFNETWFATALADFGGFGGGSDESWQAFVSGGYRFSPAWSLQVGYRYMDVERRIDGEDVAIDLSGPLLGVTYRF